MVSLRVDGRSRNAQCTLSVVHESLLSSASSQRTEGVQKLMSMMTVPSLAPGARTLPGELRIPHGYAYGWHRLHQNLAPLTEPPVHDPRVSLSGFGDVTIPVDPPISVSPRTFPNLPSQAAQAAVDAVAKINARYGGNAAAAVAVVLAHFGPQVAPQAVASLQAFLTRQGLSGLGYYDANGVWQPDESPYPVVTDTGTTSASSTDWASIIAAASQGINQTLAITQGGSVTGSGIYGSTQTANVAASYPPNQLNIGGAGVSGILSSPMLLLLIGAGILLVVAKK